LERQSTILERKIGLAGRKEEGGEVHLECIENRFIGKSVHKGGKGSRKSYSLSENYRCRIVGGEERRRKKSAMTSSGKIKILFKTLERIL